MSRTPQGKTLLKDVKGKPIAARTQGQHLLAQTILENDITFATGPAGTGKTFLSVAMAVKALQEEDFSKIVLVRPVVEAGENLGFLPGSFVEKMGPYIRPLYDALDILMKADNKPTSPYQEDTFYKKGKKEKKGKKGKSFTPPIHPPAPSPGMMGENESVKWGDKVEICPLAYMRGRSLNKCFMILDEAQNATREQMKMFLTRMGEGSKIVVVGDDRQIDLPYAGDSGLIHAMNILYKSEGIGIVELDESDIVRHPLVKIVVKAYDIDSERRDRMRDAGSKYENHDEFEEFDDNAIYSNDRQEKDVEED